MMPYTKPPKLLSVQSTVIRCAYCKRWLGRGPTYLYDDGCFFDCECGSTSVIVSVGRPYGPKSREWSRLVAEFNDVFEQFVPYEWDTVQTDPPMKDLDWAYIQKRERADGIFRWVIG